MGEQLTRKLPRLAQVHELISFREIGNGLLGSTVAALWTIRLFEGDTRSERKEELLGKYKRTAFLASHCHEERALKAVLQLCRKGPLNLAVTKSAGDRPAETAGTRPSVDPVIQQCR